MSLSKYLKFLSVLFACLLMTSVSSFAEDGARVDPHWSAHEENASTNAVATPEKVEAHQAVAEDPARTKFKKLAEKVFDTSKPLNYQNLCKEIKKGEVAPSDLNNFIEMVQAQVDRVDREISENRVKFKKAQRTVDGGIPTLLISSGLGLALAIWRKTKGTTKVNTALVVGGMMAMASAAVVTVSSTVDSVNIENDFKSLTKQYLEIGDRVRDLKEFDLRIRQQVAVIRGQLEEINCTSF